MEIRSRGEERAGYILEHHLRIGIPNGEQQRTRGREDGLRFIRCDIDRPSYPAHGHRMFLPGNEKREAVGLAFLGGKI